MTAPEVQWVLDRIDEYYGYGVLPYGTDAYGDPPPLQRVDRDNSQDLDDVRSVTEPLKDGNIVAATLANYDTSPIGTEYDHRVNAVVGLRIVGLHYSEWGHVDPAGEDGAPWAGLVQAVRRALLEKRTYPDVGRTDVTYTDLQLTNPSPLSHQYGDHYRYDVDVEFRGYEDLP